MTVKSFLLLSSLGLVLTAQAQDCTAPPLPENMSLRDNDVTLTEFPEGTKIGYTCNIGYRSAGGSPTSVCSAGSWSPVAMKCERKNCGSAGEVLNGDVDYPQGTLFGDTAVVVCNNGYVLVGKSQINCGDQGWMERLPYCEVVACDPPGQVFDGTFSPEKDSYEYRDVVVYSCRKDLVLKGSATLSCSEDGTFTPALPTCEKVECDKPDIPFARRIGGYISTYKYKETVRHECISGYERIGESSSVCEINGQWVPKLMSCKAKDCTTPVGNKNMRLSDKDSASKVFPHDTSATFVCDDGYELDSGSGGIKCTAGEWSPLTLKCKKTGSGGGDKDDGDEGNPGNNTGRNVGIAVAVIAVVAVCIVGGIFYQKKKKQGFHKGNPENGTTGDEGASMQLT